MVWTTSIGIRNPTNRAHKTISPIHYVVTQSHKLQNYGLIRSCFLECFRLVTGATLRARLPWEPLRRRLLRMQAVMRKGGEGNVNGRVWACLEN